jgi:hypothetical protein
MHPERRAVLDREDQAPRSSEPNHLPPRRPRGRKKPPGYFDKELALAERKKQEAEARANELEKREQEKQRKMAERERYRKTMAKARTGPKNGRRKLGRESVVLLEKVKKLVGGKT